jgi:hypothetical protein
LRDEVGIVLVLHGRRKRDNDVYPTQEEKFRVAFVLSYYEFKNKEVENEPHDKNDMQA